MNAGNLHANLSSNYSTQFEDNRCLLLIEMTCTTHNLTSLRWWFDDREISSYTYFTESVFPHLVDISDLDTGAGIRIVIISATPTLDASDSFSGISVLTTNTTVLSRLNVDRIQCGTNAIRSQSIDVQMLKRKGNSKYQAIVVVDFFSLVICMLRS